jgi:hypothetical protein
LFTLAMSQLLKTSQIGADARPCHCAGHTQRATVDSEPPSCAMPAHNLQEDSPPRSRRAKRGRGSKTGAAGEPAKRSLSAPGTCRHPSCPGAALAGRPIQEASDGPTAHVIAIPGSGAGQAAADTRAGRQVSPYDRMHWIEVAGPGLEGRRCSRATRSANMCKTPQKSARTLVRGTAPEDP